MADLSSCYFCGTAMDAPLEEYAVVPEELHPGDRQATVVLCPTCHRKLSTVLDRVVDAVEASPNEAVQSSLTTDDAAAGGETGDTGSEAGGDEPRDTAGSERPASDADEASSVDETPIEAPDDFDADPDDIIESVGDDEFDIGEPDDGEPKASEAGDEPSASDEGKTPADDDPVTASSDDDDAEPIFDGDDDAESTEDEVVFAENGDGSGATPDAGPGVEEEREEEREDVEEKAGETDASPTEAPPADEESAGEATPVDDASGGDGHEATTGEKASHGESTPSKEEVSHGESTPSEEEASNGEGTASGMGPSAEDYNRVVRLLQNRDFPVEREEIRTVATNAYGIAPREFDAVIETAVDRGVIEEDDGLLKLPGE